MATVPEQKPRITVPKRRALERIHARETYVGQNGTESQTIGSLLVDKLIELSKSDPRFKYALTDAGRKAIGARRPRQSSSVREEVERLYTEGWSPDEIADAVGWSTKNPNAVIATYRRRGWNLPPRDQERSAAVRAELAKPYEKREARKREKRQSASA